jgi:cytochrome c oxidase cbb3-type subunit 3/ubiquinol-cytochrome c reductase cytochrome c subunit
MKTRSLILCALACAATLATAGCKNPPGKPGAEPETPRPEQVVDFSTLYAENCASCHGVNGQNGAAISLANPVYIAAAGVSNMQHFTAVGVPHTAMPAFAKSSGGMLTDQQIAIIAQGIAATWGKPAALAGASLPSYASTTSGDPTRGKQAFTNLCARCHGADATGGKAENGAITGSLIDPAYLALISDQGLRSIVISGQPEQGMPDWRHHLTGSAARPMTEQEIADVVSWLTSHRIATPGQPYQQQQ